MSEALKKREGLLIASSLFFVTILTRIPFASKYLYHWDSVQFALALERYDITVHQPHPPGYFLYIMIGRLLYHFISDANTVFITISIVFSGLTVVVLYFLGRDLYNGTTGIIAALIALTSPNFWFHGEVALSYVVEVFFSSLVAYLCWKIIKGEHKYIWLSAIALGLAGGIRQSTVVFLFPLWLFSIRAVPIKKVVLSIGLLGLVCISWFVPMVWMTGGWDAYREAFRELWEFNTGHNSVFEKGWPFFRLYSSTLLSFILLSTGLGGATLAVAAHFLVKNKSLKSLNTFEVLFYSLWMLPPILFYLLVFIQPGNPGYVLIFSPPLFLLIAKSIPYMGNRLSTIREKSLTVLQTLLIVILNASIFTISPSDISYGFIKKHDIRLKIIFNDIRSFRPDNTVVFATPLILDGFRHIMYYLPDYRVYLAQVRTSPQGVLRQTFWGSNRETHLAKEITLPDSISDFVSPMLFDKEERNRENEKVITRKLPFGIYVSSGSITQINTVYPDLSVGFEKHMTEKK